jgi:hypothetical protein
MRTKSIAVGPEKHGAENRVRELRGRRLRWRGLGMTHGGQRQQEEREERNINNHDVRVRIL